jgi:PTH1 family peptidyl-tRNA hydrolase
MRVVVGLGNPGAKYAGTRHNIGFMVIDYLAESPRAGRFQSRFQGQVAEVMEDDEKVLLVKPETFMNLSGRCVRPQRPLRPRGAEFLPGAGRKPARRLRRH